MAEKTENAAAVLDAAGVQKLISDAVSPILESIKPLAEGLKGLTENQKVIADTMAADARAKADAAAAAGADKGKDGKGDVAKALTAEDVAKLMKETIAGELKARDEAARSTADRDKFIGEKLKGVPAAYHGQLGSDPAKWAEQEQKIREQFKADLTAVGAKVPDVTSGNPGGGQADATAKTAASQNLSPGQAAFAAGIKIPTA